MGYIEPFEDVLSIDDWGYSIAMLVYWGVYIYIYKFIYIYIFKVNPKKKDH